MGGLQRVERLLGVDAQRAVGPHGQRGLQLLRQRRGPDGQGNHFAPLGIADAQGFLDRQLVEGVDLVLQLVGDQSSGRREPHLGVALWRAFDGGDDFHGQATLVAPKWRGKRETTRPAFARRACRMDNFRSGET